jgi:hypothetical protein
MLWLIYFQSVLADVIEPLNNKHYRDQSKMSSSKKIDGRCLSV